MGLNLQTILDAPIIELDTIDSTNNYAMQLIDADTAQYGLTIISREQTAGKGQRGKTWLDKPGESILMSIISRPRHVLDEQFLFNAATTVAIVDVLLSIYENWDVRIKWPNDIIINDKKAGGILIENVIRGENWSFSVIGLGLNVLQPTLPINLPYATSLSIESGINYNIMDLCLTIRKEILRSIEEKPAPEQIIKQYNKYLYRKDAMQRFSEDGMEWKARIIETLASGKLLVQTEDNLLKDYTHGTVTWVWE